MTPPKVTPPQYVKDTDITDTTGRRIYFRRFSKLTIDNIN